MCLLKVVEIDEAYNARRGHRQKQLSRSTHKEAKEIELSCPECGSENFWLKKTKLRCENGHIVDHKYAHEL